MSLAASIQFKGKPRAAPKAPTVPEFIPQDVLDYIAEHGALDG